MATRLVAKVKNGTVVESALTVGNQEIATAETVAATPEPSTFVLLGTGMLAMAGAARRRMFTS